jgi:hypothetical protein
MLLAALTAFLVSVGLDAGTRRLYDARRQLGRANCNKLKLKLQYNALVRYMLY